MIVTCEECRSKFNLEDSLVRPTGSKVRCSNCKNVFIVYTSSTPETGEDSVGNSVIEDDNKLKPDALDQTEIKLDYGDDDLDLSEIKLDYGDDNLDLSDIDLADEFGVDSKIETDTVLDETISGEPDLSDIKFDFDEEFDLEPESDVDLSEIKIDFDDENVVLPVEAGNDLFEEDFDRDIENMLNEIVPDNSESQHQEEELDLELKLEPVDEAEFKEESFESGEFLSEEDDLGDLFAEESEVLSEEIDNDTDNSLLTEDVLADSSFSFDESEEENSSDTDDILDMKVNKSFEADMESDDILIENIDIPDFDEDFSSLEDNESSEDSISPEEKEDILEEIEALGDLNEEVEDDDIDELDDIDEEEPEIRTRRGFSLTIFFLLLAVLISCGVYLGIKRNYIDISKVTIPTFLSKYLKINNSDPYGNQKLTVFKESMDSRFIANSRTGKLFVITGKIKNNYTDIRNYISIVGSLYTTDKKFVQSKNVYAGNLIPDLELSNLDVEEIDNHLQNRSGDNQINSIGIEPGKFIPFMIVFPNINVKLTEFTVEVVNSTQK